MKNIIQFCKECVTELKRVSWPSLNEVLSSVKIVLVSTICMAVVLGVLDMLFTEGFRLIF